ncbi:MAG: PAS domain-containing protein [Polyangiaceae bacterium]|nr:PAS domain-containing protein [Polyangiaceae bacterium]
MVPAALVSFCLNVTCAVLVGMRARASPQGRALVRVCLAQAAVVAGFLVESSLGSLHGRVIADGAQLALDGLLTAEYVNLALAYARRPHRPWLVRCFGLPAVGAAGVIVTSGAHRLVRGQATLQGGRLTYPFEVVDYVGFAAMMSLVCVAIAILVSATLRERGSRRVDGVALVACVSAPLVGGFLALLGLEVGGERDNTPLLVGVTAAGATVTFLRSRSMALGALARELVVDRLREAVIVVDDDQRVVDWNPTAERLVSPLELGAPLERAWRERLLGAQSSFAEGERVWEVSRTPVESGWLVVARDVTELTRQVEARTAALEEAAARLRAIFDNAHQFLGLLDAEGRVLAANRAALEFAGVREEDVLGRPFRETVWWDRHGRELLDPALEQARRGRFARFETVHEVGERRAEIDFTLSPAVHDGRVAFLVPEGRDITALREAERERARLGEERSRSERLELLGRLAAGVAHDFNNLLAVVGCSVDLLAEEASLSGEGRQTLLDIRETMESGASLTRQLLAFSRQNRLGEPVVEEVDAVVARSMGMLRRLLGDAIDLEMALSGGPVLIVPGQLEQCIMNLVVNARDASQPGGRVAIVTKVQRSERLSGREVVLEVVDVGSGMTEEVLARALDPFFSTKAPGKGTGLGLATVARIAAEAGGYVTIESKVGEGTRVAVHLPLHEGDGGAE